MINRIFICVFLGIGAICDLKDKTIHSVLLAVGGAVSLGLAVAGIITGSLSYLQLFSGAALGLGMLLISAVTGEKLGRGDAIIACICFPLIGAIEGLTVLLVSFLMAAAVSVVVLIVRKCGTGYRLPFIPFLFGGMLTVILGG